MWTYVLKSNVDKYLKEYPSLSDHFETLCLYETKDACFLPRLFVENFPSKELIIHNGKKQIDPESIKIKFKGKLREDQKPIIRSVLNRFKKYGHLNGIIKARPGIGKTVMTIYLAHALGLKVCVIVDNSGLMKQWISRIYEFTDLTEDDIGIIKQKINVTNKPITVAMCQTLLSKLKNNIQFAFNFVDESRFGLVVYDEVHNTSSSEKFAKISLLFRTKNILGLSATPFQTGTAEILMNNTIGNLIYETNDYDLKPSYYMVYYDSGLGSKETNPKKKNYAAYLARTHDYIRRKAFYNKVIINSPIYINLIGRYTFNLVKNNHNVIIICFTKKQVLTISEKLDSIGVVHRRYYGDEQEIDLDNDRVLVVTYSYCGKGFDMKRLSALIFATPLAGRKSIIQTVGRILREYDGKQKPVVVDLIDMAFPFISLKEVKQKSKIIMDEFQIPINEHREY